MVTSFYNGKDSTIKGLKETTHGYKKERNKANDFTCKLQYDVSIFSNRRHSDFTKCSLMISQREIMISRLVQLESSYSGVTVIWVPLWFVYPHTHITRDMSIPRGDIHSTGSENNRIRNEDYIFSIYIFDTAANLYYVILNKLTVYDYVKVKHKNVQHPCEPLSIFTKYKTRVTPKINILIINVIKKII